MKVDKIFYIYDKNGGNYLAVDALFNQLSAHGMDKEDAISRLERLVDKWRDFYVNDAKESKEWGSIQKMFPDLECENIFVYIKKRKENDLPLTENEQNTIENILWLGGYKDYSNNDDDDDDI